VRIDAVADARSTAVEPAEIAGTAEDEPFGGHVIGMVDVLL